MMNPAPGQNPPVQQTNESGEIWYPPTLGAFLNRWFAKYDDARSSLVSEGGFLFPYRNQFFVCEGEAVRVMGLDPTDPDWKEIGHDAARPKDGAAFNRLLMKRRKASGKMA